jgi:hypothetical protein
MKLVLPKRKSLKTYLYNIPSLVLFTGFVWITFFELLSFSGLGDNFRSIFALCLAIPIGGTIWFEDPKMYPELSWDFEMSTPTNTKSLPKT